MAISKISFKENDITSKNSEKSSLVSQVSNNNNRLERTEKSDNVVIKNKNKSEWKKYTLGGIVILALLVGGDFLFTKGRYVKKIFGVKEAEEAKKNIEEGAKNVFESISKFTEEGNSFKDYKAWTSDNKLFSGKVKTASENGGTNIFEYNKGILKSVESLDKDGNIIKPTIQPLPPHVTDGVLTVNSAEMNRFSELQGIYGVQYDRLLSDIENFVKRHQEYGFLPSGGHPIFRLNNLLHEFIQKNPEVADLELVKQLERLKSELPKEYNDVIQRMNCITSTMMSDTSHCYKGTQFVEGKGVGKDIYSKFLVEPSREFEHTYDIRTDGSLDLHQRPKIDTNKKPPKSPPPSGVAQLNGPDNPPPPASAALPLNQLGLPNDVINMINSMFRNSQKILLEAIEAAEAILTKHPNANKEIVGIAMKLKFGGLKPEVKEKAEKALDEFLTTHQNITKKEVEEISDIIYKIVSEI